MEWINAFCPQKAGVEPESTFVFIHDWRLSRERSSHLFMQKRFKYNLIKSGYNEINCVPDKLLSETLILSILLYSDCLIVWLTPRVLNVIVHVSLLNLWATFCGIIEEKTYCIVQFSNFVGKRYFVKLSLDEK